MGVGHLAVTGSGVRLPAETASVLGCPSAGHSRAPTGNSPAYYFKPETRYRARLAHTMYVYEEMTLDAIALALGVTRQRVHQYVRAVEPTLDGRLVQKEREGKLLRCGA